MSQERDDRDVLAELDELDEFDEMDEWGDPDDEMQIGLPLRAESFVGGIPQVIADYFEIDPGDVATITALFCALESVWLQEGADDGPRIYLHEEGRGDAPLTPKDLIGIVTFRANRMRLETGTAEHARVVREQVERMLGRRARHRERRRENPFEEEQFMTSSVRSLGRH